MTKYINSAMLDARRMAHHELSYFREMMGTTVKLNEITDPIDTVTLDVPLLIRLLEYAREDAKTDMDLHNVAQKAIALSKEHSALSMEHYDTIVSKDA